MRARRFSRFRPLPLVLALARIGCGSLLIPALTAAPALAQLPTGGTVAGGTATIRNVDAGRQVIIQGTDKAIINWRGFSIGQGASVQFVQPGATSVVLNRVTGNDPSSIFGTLSANGRVFLVNPFGIYFAPGASLDVGGLVASTLNIRDNDFLSGNYAFYREPGSPAGVSVVNDGRGTNAKLGGPGRGDDGLLVIGRNGTPEAGQAGR